ncbi:cortactin-binding protein 2-like isoform X1 [Schistocerca cancellata]|uniref:cortactin-binding protein 2-like isoform X1 n=1 Tax=Schistocerca cancellata TaxID=274614 RepID=UPI002118BE8E|nr:cortactin-binding protein 2-like isoform X1 [Schistocerca cancellata]
MEAVKDVTETVTVDLGALLDAGDDATVILEAGDTRLVAHRAVLADRSPVLAAMFAHDTLERSTSVVRIADVGGPVLRQLVSYLYTLRAPQLPGTAPQLLAAADKYGASGLKAECERQVAAQLTVETAAAAAVLAVRHSCSDLRRAAIEFIKACPFEVMATQGWADAMLHQPKDLIEVSRLLYDPPPKSSAPVVMELSTTTRTTTTSAAAATSASALRQTPAAAQPTTTQPDKATVSQMRAPVVTELSTTTRTTTTSAAAAVATSASAPCQTPAAARPTTPPPDEATVSQMRAPVVTELSTTTRTTTTSAAAAPSASAPCQTPAAARPTTPPPDEATVSQMRSLSEEERGRRLREAAEEGAVEEVRALLAAGADVGAGDEVYGWTALHWAAGRGDAAVVRLLLSAASDPNARTLGGQTPLHLAARNGHAEAAAALLQAGADRGVRTDWGNTPLDFARQQNRQQLVEMLTER